MWVGNLCASLDEQVTVSVLKREEMRGRDRIWDRGCGWRLRLLHVCLCTYTHVFGWHLFRASVSWSRSGCLAFSCVCTRHCVVEPSCLLLLLTRPLLFSCLPDRQYARAPPQSFIGSYCPLSQIQYASIDCVEMQSGSPQQRSKQSKFNKTPPLVSGLALVAPPKEEQMYLCVWKKTKRGSFMQPQLLLDSEEPLKPHKQNVQEVTLALTSLPAYWQQQSVAQAKHVVILSDLRW